MNQLNTQITKTQLRRGAILPPLTISIEAKIKLFKQSDKRKNNFVKLTENEANMFCVAEKEHSMRNETTLNVRNDNRDRLKQTPQTNRSENVTADDGIFNSNRLCAENQVREIKRLIDIIARTIRLKQLGRDSKMPSRVEKLHRKIEDLKNQMMKSKYGCQNQDEEEVGATSKCQSRSSTVENITFNPHENYNLHLNLSSRHRRTNKKKQWSNPVPDECNKCNPLKNSNRCIPYMAMSHQNSLVRKMMICYCYCAYTRGFDGVTYHTLCQCCKPITNYRL